MCTFTLRAFGVYVFLNGALVVPVRQKIRALVQFLPPAEAFGHTSIVASLTRIQTYERPAKISQDDARARVGDLWRCHPPHTVYLEAIGATKWRSQTSAAPGHEEWIVVDGKTEAMFLDAPWQDRARNRRRRTR